MRIDTRPLRRISRRVGRAGPFVAIVLLLAWPAMLARGGASQAEIARLKEIAELMGEVPMIVGRWASTNVEVPTEATQILRPNAILSRRFSEIGGTGAVTLALIHCSDVRDMHGHFPPVCYPASGWTLDASKRRTLDVVTDDGRTWPLRVYRFTRAEAAGATRVMTVLNAFILPDGTLSTEGDTLNERVTKKAVSARGIAQVQFLFDGDVDEEIAMQYSKELLSALPASLLRLLSGGAKERGSVLRPDVGPIRTQALVPGVR